MNRAAAIGLTLVERRLREVGLLVAGALADTAVHGVSDDSRTVRPGDLFCAWKGTAFDAHDFVPAAARAGASAALVERPVPGAGIPQVVVRDGREAAAIGAAFVFGDPQSALVLAGVTGTNGKTTTVWIVRHLLGARWRAASIGTLGVLLEDGSLLEGSERLTTPGPVDLARTLRLLADRGVQCVAMEVSSHALDQKRVHALQFAAAVFTNLTRDHLDYHGTIERYRDAKLLLAAQLAPAGGAAVNATERAWDRVADMAPRVLRFAIGAKADLVASGITPGEHGCRFDCKYGGRTVTASLPLAGAFNVENAIAAISACLVLDMELEETCARLATLPQVPGRLERLTERPFVVLRDYAHTPDALSRALRAARPLARGRLIVVFGAGGDRDRGKRPLMGEAAASLADVVIVTSDNPRTEDPASIIDEIVAPLLPERAQRVTDRREAIATALTLARPGDVVMLAGKGHETYQVIGTTRIPFDESVIVRDWLAKGGVAQ
ncbi:MAG: UDP-N-acetylmuramoyl-L-alanyl-D-glutamate--2,6-diaminopimelate ligase [Gemmatimonadetes bacterium]|nr:UDP-N-acetylmuramoyl-L-alanyl-D-glutamate--2,6-diaminopimelate ligase [Gemmatimonadota bacterium]